MVISKAFEDYSNLLACGVPKSEAIRAATSFWEHCGVTIQALSEYVGKFE